ncbi:GFA family protein [Oceaniglobus roseus]|uniref:GFA family protein n=1 Tax=Oceaniglobus roseus TaxID=1737570 RepID=UPI0015625D2D|nr:GFA family protein [Kandeliimicrobium roseum]
MAEPLVGRCLCRAVTITVATHRPEVGACHCGMCQRWSGAAYFMFTAPPEAVRIEGPVTEYRSSSFATRAFCGTCGSPLWLRDDGSDYELMPGLFPGAKDFPLVSEVYADRRLASVQLAGDHRRATAAEYEASHPFVDGSET